MKVFRAIHDYIHDHFKRNTPDMDDVLDVPDIVDMYTYDDNSNNPLSFDFWERHIDNKISKSIYNTQNHAAKVPSAYASSYFMPNKTINLPADYKDIVEVYKKSSIQAEKKTDI